MSIGEFGVEGPVPEEVPVCGAVMLRAQIMMQLDAAERAAEITGEQSEFFNYAAVPAIDCQTCDGIVEVTGYQSISTVSAPRCTSVISGSCEESWAALHPEKYLDKNGQPTQKKLPCAGLGCLAAIKFEASEDGLIRQATIGTCAVNAAGERFTRTGRETMNQMHAMPLTDEVPLFDGQI